ncbi:MAG: hypothetical protein J6M65_05545 [Eubacterium sp.]|nr:hypothetical protein [Eubacterium sp.]
MAEKNKNNFTIDFRNGFLRVGRGVIKSLDTPSYISLMINDEKKILAVMAADKEGVMTFRVPEGFPDAKNKAFRIYSKGFAGIIARKLSIEDENKIKLAGYYDEGMDAVVFFRCNYKLNNNNGSPGITN